MFRSGERTILNYSQLFSTILNYSEHFAPSANLLIHTIIKP